MKRIFVASSAIVLVCVAQAAAAQVAPEQAAQASTAQADETPTPGDIIVTAQRRSERLKDVPIALVARSAQELEQAGAVGIRDLTVVTPGLRIQGNGANVQPAIRGVHSDQTDPGNDANVAIYIDGIYQSSQIANNIELADIERVEVLKGPQGTLFGRNATGGAIRIFTREPTSTAAGMLDASYGNLDEVQLRGFLSGPIAGDTLSASLSGYYLRQDGFTRDIIRDKTVGGLESGSLRGKLLFQPSDRLKIELIGGYTKRRDENATLYQPLDGRSAALAVPGAIVPTRPRQTAVNQPAITRSRLYTGAVKADLETDAGTLSSITAYTDVRALYNTDAEFSQLLLLGYPIFERQRDFSEELTFASETFGIVQATGGLFYFRGRGKYDPLIVEGAFVPTSLFGYFNQNTEAYAAFGEATITPTERLSIILGARYSHERRTASGSYFLTDAPSDPLPRLGRASFGQFTPRVSVRYTLPSDDNVYATYSRGFKSGGFSISSGATDPFFPEKLDAFEVGLKTSAQRTISANLSAFYYIYSDQQVQASVNNFNITANAASSRLYGVDADILIRPTRELSVTLAASWLHARFRNYPNAVVNEPCGIANCTAIIDASGLRQPYSPDYTFGATAAWDKEIDAGKIALSGSFYATSRIYYDNNERVSQPGYTMLAARAGFTPASSGLTIYAYGRNLTNKRYINTVFINNLGDGVTYATPRTYGVGASYRF